MDQLLDLIESAFALIGFFATIVFIENYFRNRDTERTLRRIKKVPSGDEPKGTP